MFAPQVHEECIKCGKVIRTVYGSAEWHEANDPMPFDGWCGCIDPETQISRDFAEWENNKK